jgi:hypothetical protein
MTRRLKMNNAMLFIILLPVPLAFIVGKRILGRGFYSKTELVKTILQEQKAEQ